MRKTLGRQNYIQCNVFLFWTFVGLQAVEGMVQAVPVDVKHLESLGASSRAVGLRNQSDSQGHVAAHMGDPPLLARGPGPPVQLSPESSE